TEGRTAGRITKEALDVYQNRRRSEELGVDQAGIIVLLSGDKRRFVTIDELYTFREKKRDAFRGEQVVTAAILDVSTLGREKIYFLSGHGELRIDNTDAQVGLSTVRNELNARNFELEALDLTAVRKIPDDASLLVIVAPQSSFTRAEQEILRQYMGAKAGRMILFLPTGKSTAALGLDELLLDDWGVLVHNDVIFDPENISENLDLLVRAFAPTHPITKTLVDIGSQPLRFGMARTVVPDPGRAQGGGLNTVTLAATSPNAWGERGGSKPGTLPRYDPGIDTRAIPGLDPPNRLGVIVASERLAVRDNLPFSVRGGKLVVFGTGDLITNARIDAASLRLILNAVNWSVDRDHALAIPPRTIERFHLAISARDFTRLRYALMLALPGGALLLGVLVYWTRRA
ncbi:MAG: Gldg family protein, partial [Opitutaceae bacterium]